MQALIHEMSSSIPLPRLDLFGVPPTQTMVERDIVTEHRPITSLEPSSFIQFELNSADDEYLDLEKLILYFKIKVKKNKAIATEADWETISPVNYLLHSMIKQVDIFIGDKQISTTNPTYGYKAYFEAFFGFSKDQKQTHLTSALWYDDEDLKEEILVKKQSKYLRNYRELDLMGRLHTDLTFQGRNLIGGTKLIFRILLNDPKFYLMSKTHKPEVEILEAALFAHRAKVSQHIVEAHHNALRISTAKYPITMNKLKPFTIPKGAFDANIDNVHSGQLPRRIFIAFVKNLAYYGDYNLNPFYFEHFNISSLAVYLDGIQYPAKAFAPDFSEKVYQRELYSLYEALDMLDSDPTFYINRDNYDNGNTIFGINFAPDLSSGCGAAGHLNQLKFGSLRLTVRFSKALDEPITVLIFCEFDKLLEIDINRKASLDLF